ncbi:hypothetical protein [Kutzneria sp. NPDC051319]|uniref:hypothetical protein n=1 Tax=Kutzneria sp. NPDC051319 TaxID=3155047 RepID=UPI00341F71B9
MPLSDSRRARWPLPHSRTRANCPTGDCLWLHESNDYGGGIAIIDAPTRSTGFHGGPACPFRHQDRQRLQDRQLQRAPIQQRARGQRQRQLGSEQDPVDPRFFKDAGFSGEQFQLPSGEFFSTVGKQNDSFSSVGSISH